MNRFPILVVDDERVARESLAAWLREDGYRVDVAASGVEALELAARSPYALYFLDLKMPPGLDGVDTLIELRRRQPGATVAIITAHGTVDSAISALKAGAQEYLLKPCNPEEVSLFVQRVLRVHRLERENAVLRKRLSRQYRVEDIVGRDPRMLELFERVREIASLPSTVLIEGESGTGKELVARAIHFSGDRAAGPFVAVSCAALTETLLESELFGHERGAFTGATARKRGKFELADGGTLLLDEIDDIPPKLQGDLLRVLQERRFFRVGGTEELAVNVRVIAATRSGLAERVRLGRFREDLFYRLDVIRIHLPPLRERSGDVPLLAQHLLEKHALELRRDVNELSPEAVAKLVSYDWPGNVRELENAIERALVGGHGASLEAADFAFLGDGARGTAATGGAGEDPYAGLPLHEVERRAIEATLRRCGGNVTEAARMLAVDRSSLYDRMKRFAIAH